MSHELPPPPSNDWPDVRHWRVGMRKALIGGRMALAPELRKTQGDAAKRRLIESVDLSRFRTLGIYWPVRGEIDVRDLASAFLEGGGRVALPVVVTQSAPLEFWRWEPGMPMSKGIWNIPIPQRREVLHPEALIVPLVGWDPARYRLGYGGGYYDRTIAAAVVRPFRVGLGYQAARLDSIFPQTHDLPMDLIITDESRT